MSKIEALLADLAATGGTAGQAIAQCVDEDLEYAGDKREHALAMAEKIINLSNTLFHDLQQIKPGDE